MWLRILLIALLPMAALGGSTNGPGPLAWNTLTNKYTSKPGDLIARFSFTATNVSRDTVVIENVKPSCGCTSAKLPGKPWILKPAEGGKVEVSVDLRGKSGVLYKSLTILSTNAPGQLMIELTIPPGGSNNLSAEMANRMWNQEMSAADRQAVFRNDCAKCHLEPAFGKQGEALYKVACAICHDSAHRATMVPNLASLKKEIPADYWKNWIAHGKDGTLMPAFAATEGGPLEDQQMASLADFLLKKYPDLKPPPPKAEKRAEKGGKKQP